jgi:hypothetical protein
VSYPQPPSPWFDPNVPPSGPPYPTAHSEPPMPHSGAPVPQSWPPVPQSAAPYQPVPAQYSPMPNSPVSYTPVPYSPVVPAPLVVVQQPPSSGLAVASLVLGILGLTSGCCTFGIFSILAVIFGHAGLAETRDGRKSGRGMAQAGLVMGYVVAGPAIALSIFVVFGSGLTAITGAAAS